MSFQDAHAILDVRQDILLIETVSETSRGAIVNYLVRHRGMLVTKFWDDARIKQAWATVPEKVAKLVQVHVTLVG